MKLFLYSYIDEENSHINYFQHLTPIQGEGNTFVRYILPEYDRDIYVSELRKLQRLRNFLLENTDKRRAMNFILIQKNSGIVIETLKRFKKEQNNIQIVGYKQHGFNNSNCDVLLDLDLGFPITIPEYIFPKKLSILKERRPSIVFPYNYDPKNPVLYEPMCSVLPQFTSKEFRYKNVTGLTRSEYQEQLSKSRFIFIPGKKEYFYQDIPIMFEALFYFDCIPIILSNSSRTLYSKFLNIDALYFESKTYNNQGLQMLKRIRKVGEFAEILEELTQKHSISVEAIKKQCYDNFKFSSKILGGELKRITYYK